MIKIKTKLVKNILALTMVGTLAITSAATQVAAAVDTECVEPLSIDSCAANIKSIFKTKYPEQADMIDKIVDRATKSEEFIYIFEQEGASAFRIIENSLIDTLDSSASPCASTDETYYTSYFIPEVKQINSNFCGPASTVMALIGSGAPDYYTTNMTLTNRWQQNVANQMPQSKGDVAYVYEVTDIMKNNVADRNNYSYDYRGFWDNSYSTYLKALDYLEISLIYDAVPILMVDSTKWFNYYSGGDYRHYMVVECVDIVAEEITVVDPNNLNNKYFGRHNISFAEFKEMCLNTDEFWIIAYMRS